MSDFKPRPGTFRPYMEYANREKLAQRPPASPLTLLEILTRQTQQSLPLFELQTQSGMDPSRYATALKSLRDPGYVAIDGEALEQVVRLTDSGAQVLQLARPA
jgi:predicted transcriptional regulator